MQVPCGCTGPVGESTRPCSVLLLCLHMCARHCRPRGCLLPACLSAPSPWPLDAPLLTPPGCCALRHASSLLQAGVSARHGTTGCNLQQRSRHRRSTSRPPLLCCNVADLARVHVSPTPPFAGACADASSKPVCPCFAEQQQMRFEHENGTDVLAAGPHSMCRCNLLACTSYLHRHRSMHLSCRGSARVQQVGHSYRSVWGTACSVRIPGMAHYCVRYIFANLEAKLACTTGRLLPEAC
jgi:hypothetical protein